MSKKGSCLCVFLNKKDFFSRLKQRQAFNIDPFQTESNSQRLQPFRMSDLSVIRLCFQAYIEDHYGQLTIPLDPVVSDAIYDKKALSELNIAKLSHYSASCAGGIEVILLCDRVLKDDIQIRFFQIQGNRLIWENYGQFKSSDIHKNFAISFKAPKYFDVSITKPVSVQLQLKRLSDGETSDPVPFQMMPVLSDPIYSQINTCHEQVNYNYNFSNQQNETNFKNDFNKQVSPTIEANQNYQNYQYNGFDFMNYSNYSSENLQMNSNYFNESYTNNLYDDYVTQNNYQWESNFNNVSQVNCETYFDSESNLLDISNNTFKFA